MGSEDHKAQNRGRLGGSKNGMGGEETCEYAFMLGGELLLVSEKSFKTCPDCLVSIPMRSYFMHVPNQVPGEMNVLKKEDKIKPLGVCAASLWECFKARKFGVFTEKKSS